MTRPARKEIADILTVEATVRDLVDAFAMPLIAARLFTEHTICRMQVDATSHQRPLHLHAYAVQRYPVEPAYSRLQERRLSRLPGMVPTHSRVRLTASGKFPEFFI